MPVTGRFIQFDSASQPKVPIEVPYPLLSHYEGSINSNSLEEATRLPYVEYRVARNNYYFPRKNRMALQEAGACAQPFPDTALLVRRRMRRY